MWCEVGVASNLSDQGGAMIFHLIPKTSDYFTDSEYVVACDVRERLREIGDRWLEFGLTDGYSIVPLDRLINGAYVV
jgi:hypothetical protein